MGTARRTWFIAAITACLVLGFTTQAFAIAPAPLAYVPWSEVATLPGQKSSPHGGYTTTTVKCAVCHAVHSAPAGSEVLLPAKVSEACDYCHVSLASSYTQVYGSNPNNFSAADIPNAHNYYNGTVFSGLLCTTCHQVHGAESEMTANSYLSTKILIGPKVDVDPNTGLPNYDPLAGAPRSTDDSATALTKWCAGCHFNLGGVYYAESYGIQRDGSVAQSHVMTTATANYTNSSTFTGKVAWKNSTYCSSCHSSEFGTSEWPHYTEGERFLESGSDASAVASGAVDSSEDGVCLRCHRSGANGIGLNY